MQVHLHRGQYLAHLIVQLARHATPFTFLHLDQSPQIRPRRSFAFA